MTYNRLYLITTNLVTIELTAKYKSIHKQYD